MKEYKCEECGKIFKSKKEKKFCSWDCYKQNIKKFPLKKESKKQEVKCKFCGKIEYVTPSRAIKYVCCSRECMGKYSSIRYSQKITLKCPICGEKYEVMQSKLSHHRTCGKKECRKEWLKRTRCGENNGNYLSLSKLLKKDTVTDNIHWKSKNEYKHIVKLYLKLDSLSKIPSGYVIHHKDANHMNNVPQNLVVLPKSIHRQIHTIFGNVLINALHTGRINRETFFNICNKNQGEFYKEIIDLDITSQAVVKQGELLESPEEGNQQPSLYRNIYEGSTTNGRVLPGNTEDGNSDTSALPNNDFIGDDIV